MKKCVFLCAVFSLVLFACDNETETLTEDVFGYDYVPLNIGATWTYSSDSIIYRQGGVTRDTLSGFIQEEILDTFVDGIGEKTYKIARRFKSEWTGEWESTRIWSMKLTDQRFTRTEENIRFIKLVFPVQENVFWDGDLFYDENIFVDLEGDMIQPYRFWDYNIESLGNSFVEGNISSDEVIKVSHVNFEDLFEKRISEEYFAKGIGLVEKKMTILDTQCPNDNTCQGDTFEDWAEIGFILHQRLIEFEL